MSRHGHYPSNTNLTGRTLELYIRGRRLRTALRAAHPAGWTHVAAAQRRQTGHVGPGPLRTPLAEQRHGGVRARAAPAAGRTTARRDRAFFGAFVA